MDNLRLIAVYDDLNEKIKAIMDSIPEPKDGKDGKNGQNGRDAPDRTREMFAAVASLHASLTESLMNAQKEIKVEPTIEIQKQEPVEFRIKRNSSGLIETVTAIPVNSEHHLV